MLKMGELSSIHQEAEKETENYYRILGVLEKAAKGAGAIGLNAYEDDVRLQVNGAGFDELNRHSMENVKGFSSGGHTHIYFEVNGVRFVYCEYDYMVRGRQHD